MVYNEKCPFHKKTKVFSPQMLMCNVKIDNSVIKAYAKQT